MFIESTLVKDPTPPLHHLQSLPLQISFAKIAWFLNASETNFLQSTELTN